MIILHNSEELHKNKDSVPDSIFDFLCKQFFYLEDYEPQINSYNEPNFLCVTGTIKITFDQRDLQGLEILDETIFSDNVKFYLCQDGNQFLDVVLIEDRN